MESHDAEFREGVTLKPLVRAKARIILFKQSGKYYTEEEWEIPTQEEVIERGGNRGDSIGPFCMRYSKDFRRIAGSGPVLVDSQDPWGYPHLFPEEEQK